MVLKDMQTEKEEKIAVPAEYCMGSVRSIAVADLHLEHLIYDFEINGKKVMDTVRTRHHGAAGLE